MSNLKNMSAVDVLAVLEACGAYVDDAACFPAQFKPGLVKRHQREYNEARAVLAELIAAASRAAIAATRGDDNRPGTIRNADLDALRAALARVGGGK